jgi:ParB-like chromosome segregation protein Spo0J
MKQIGYESVPVAKMLFSGQWRQKLDDPSIPARAMSQKIVGLLHDPIVRKEDWKVFAGERRIAAEMHNGATEVWCKMVECTDEEGALASDMENAYREHLSAAGQAALVERLTPKIAAIKAAGFDPPKPRDKRGRIKLNATEAREVAAQLTGKTVETIRKAEQRTKRQKENLLKRTDINADIGIRSLGLELDDKFRKQTNDVVAATSEIAQLMTRALGRMTVLLESGLPVHAYRLGQAKESIALLGSMLRGLLPVCLCPFCKGVPALSPKCTGCMGTEYITANQEDGVPKELWNERAPLVTDNGKFAPLDAYYENEVEDSRATAEHAVDMEEGGYF